MTPTETKLKPCEICDNNTVTNPYYVREPYGGGWIETKLELCKPCWNRAIENGILTLIPSIWNIKNKMGSNQRMEPKT